MKNYYEILEVNKRASKEVIEKAYKVLVKKYHPDLYTGNSKQYAEKKLKEINEAYSVLTDEFMKEQYDVELERQEQKALYEKYNNQNNNTKKIKNKKEGKEREQKQELDKKSNKTKVGTFSGIVELCRELYKNRPKRDQIKEITKKDIIALILTIIIVVLIGVALWFIPFTNGWMRELLFENPIFNWIGGLFS